MYCNFQIKVFALCHSSGHHQSLSHTETSKGANHRVATHRYETFKHYRVYINIPGIPEKGSLGQWAVQ